MPAWPVRDRRVRQRAARSSKVSVRPDLDVRRSRKRALKPMEAAVRVAARGAAATFISRVRTTLPQPRLAYESINASLAKPTVERRTLTTSGRCVPAAAGTRYELPDARRTTRPRALRAQQRPPMSPPPVSTRAGGDVFRCPRRRDRGDEPRGRVSRARRTSVRATRDSHRAAASRMIGWKAAARPPHREDDDDRR